MLCHVIFHVMLCHLSCDYSLSQVPRELKTTSISLDVVDCIIEYVVETKDKPKVISTNVKYLNEGYTQTMNHSAMRYIYNNCYVIYQ